MVHPLKNILSGLRWDSRKNSADYQITYRHRGAPGNEKQIKASAIDTLGKSYFTFNDSSSDSDETLIPFHRVLEVRNLKTNTIVWKKREPCPSVTHVSKVVERCSK